MIEHIYIKNYKAFGKENIPLEQHGLIIGTNNSGKSTILEALDLFFNERFHLSYINDKTEDVIIECSIEEKRYRKVYSPPHFFLNYEKSIGDFFELKDYVYLFIPKAITKHQLETQILRANMHTQIRDLLSPILVKAYGYLDGKHDQVDVSFSSVDLALQVNGPDQLITNQEKTTIMKNMTYQKTIVGIDHFEDHFVSSFMQEIEPCFYQSIITTKSDNIIENYPHYIQPLYKEDVPLEENTTLRVSHNQYDKTMLLVEGKYDVAWFEKALKLLGKYQEYRVIPCGGFGNIPPVESQLRKAGFKTLIVTDGDVKGHYALKRDVIELYADVRFVNARFHTNFTRMPTKKYRLFNAIHTKDDVVKKILSSWAKNHLSKDNAFVEELGRLLT